MARMNRFLLIGRLAQILLSLTVFGCSTAITCVYAYSYDVDQSLSVASLLLGFATAVFGGLELFGIHSRPIDTRDGPLYQLLLIIDGLAFFSSAGAATCLVLAVNYNVEDALWITPTACGYLAMLIILGFAVRSIRLFYRGTFSSRVDQSLKLQPNNGWYTPPQEHYRPNYVNAVKDTPIRYPSMEDKKSFRTSRPLSGAETTAPWSDVGSETGTLTYQNMRSPGVTRASSIAAPSYTSRAYPKS